MPAGGTYNFSASCGSGLTWTVTGPGTIGSSGYYSAPSSVTAQNQSRGCQELPNNSPFNIPVNTLPIDPHSTRWLTRVAEDGTQYPSPYHNLKFYPQVLGFYDNPVTSSTQQQLMHFYYLGNSNGYQDTNFPIPPERTWLMENGVNYDAGSGSDRHLFTMNSSNCTGTEMYNLYVDFRTVSFTAGSPTSVTWTTNTVWPIPQNYSVYISGGTGAWAAANGNWRMTPTGANSGTLPFDSTSWGAAPSGTIMTGLFAPYNGPNYNSQSGQKFSPTSYAEMGGVDAAGMPMSATSLKLNEWYAATQAGRSDLGHAIRTTMSNSYLSARNIWPATLYAGANLGFQNFLTSCTNGTTTTCTASTDISTSQPCDNYTYTTGCTFYINVTGLTGAWAAFNGDQTATAVDNYHFTVSVNTSSFGAFSTSGNPYFVQDFFPYGATIILSPSVDLSGLCTSTDLTNWCPYAKVYLQTLQKYGMVVADGTVPSDNWDNSTIASEFHPNVLVDAAVNIENWTGLQPIEGYLQVVNRSSQQLSTNLASYQQTNTNRTYVTVCGSSGCASDDVILQGTTIGTDRERLTVAANTSYQMNVWLNGNVNTALSYAINSGIPGASVSSTGLLAMPSCTVKQQGMITVTSSADPNALPLYIEATCLPVGTDGAYRLALGNYTGDYTDSEGNIWTGAYANYGFNNNYESPALWYGSHNGTWQGFLLCENDTWTGGDSQLYSRSTNLDDDTRVEVALPNGNYNLTLYGEPGFGGFGSNNTCANTAGQNVYDWIVQGQTAASWLDGYVLAGNQPFNGYTLSAQATVTDNMLVTLGRMRVSSPYGVSWSSLLISPGTGQGLTIITSSLPNANVGSAYSAALTASSGTPPYTWGLANGSGPLPTGLTINASSGLISGTPTTAGTYPFTVQVTDSLQHTATRALSIVVSPAGSFTMASSPFMLSVAQGNQATGTIVSTANNGFNSSIALSASGLPAGATITFNPSTIPAPGSGSSSMTIAVASNTPTGRYAVTVTGNGGGTQQSTAISLNVTAGVGSFTISASPTLLSVVQGNQGTSTITTAISGTFNSSIALSASGLPAGAGASFNPSTIAAPGNGISIITITVGASTPTGTYPITVTGNGGGTQQTTTVTLTVTASASFGISASPTSLSIAQGNQGTSTISTIGVNGFNSSIALSASGLPSGASASFNPSTIPAPGNGSSIITITVGASTPTGTYPITVTGNGGGVQQTTTITLTVTGAPNFTISASPTSLSVAQGNHGASTITTAVSNGFNSSIALTASGLPSGTTASFNPSAIPAPGNGSSIITITVGASTPTGTYPITVTGNGGGVQQTTTVTLTVTGAPNFTISASPTSLSVAQGNHGASTITTAVSNGFNSSIALTASGLPSGTTASFNPSAIPAPGNGSSIITITVGASTPTGTYPITVTGNGGGVQQTTTITLTVTGTPNFTIAATPQSQTINRGSRTTYTVTLAPVNGFNSRVTLSLSGCPSNATCSFNPQSLTPPGSSTLTVSTGYFTQDGNYTLTITGTSGSLRNSTTVGLTVTH